LSSDCYGSAHQWGTVVKSGATNVRRRLQRRDGGN
jgi:hypothetical protein